MFKKNLKKINVGNGKDGKTRVRPNSVSGFTVLFAVIVSSLILALGLGIVAITMKEVKLSGAGRDSQLAFYAADSGSECAIYQDIVKSVFPTSTSRTVSLSTCNNQDITGDAIGNGSSATTTFKMCMEYDSGGCVTNKPYVDVSVYKYIDGSNKAKTIIDSRGYNTGELSNPRRLERGYRVQY
jgi:Tfp pilus assembly protein PilX